jgi:hypothetical protein
MGKIPHHKQNPPVLHGLVSTPRFESNIVNFSERSERRSVV